MERTFLWLALALGGLGSLVGLAMAFSGGKRSTGSILTSSLFLLMAGCLPWVVFVVTLPTGSPFSTGQGFGRGFLLGGLIAYAGALLATRLIQNRGSEATSLALATLFSAATLVMSVPSLWMRTGLPDGLLGVAIGWFCVSLTLLAGHAVASGDTHRTEADQTLTTALTLTLTAGIGFAVTLCALALLGEYRRPFTPTGATEPIHWSAPGLLVAACVPLILLLVALPTALFVRLTARLPFPQAVGRSYGRLFVGEEGQAVGVLAIRSLAGVLLLTVLSSVLSRAAGVFMPTFPILGKPVLMGMALPVTTGLLAGLVAWWTVAARTRAVREGSEPRNWQGSALAVLVVLAAGLLAYQKYAGFGIALMAIGFWLVAGTALTALIETAEPLEITTPFQNAAQLVQLGLFAAALLLYRVFATRFEGSVAGLSLTDQYALFGILAGAVLPAVLGGYFRRHLHSAPATLFQLLLVGALSLVIPGTLLLLFNLKLAQAVLIGLALGIVTTESLAPAPRAQASATQSHFAQLRLPPLFALAVGLALAQWTDLLLPFADMVRAERVGLLKWAVIGLVAVMLAGEVGGRLLGRRTPNLPGAKGVA